MALWMAWRSEGLEQMQWASEIWQPEGGIAAKKAS